MKTMDVEKIRSDFPMLQTTINGKPLVYLDNSATTHKPRQVIDTIVDFYTTMNANIHRGAYSLGHQASNRYESARASVKEFIGASSPEEIIFTSGTTASLNLIAQSYGNMVLGNGDEIIITEMEHHANIIPWQALCERKKARLKVVSIDDQGELCLDELESRSDGMGSAMGCSRYHPICVTQINHHAAEVRHVTHRIVSEILGHAALFSELV